MTLIYTYSNVYKNQLPSSEKKTYGRAGPIKQYRKTLNKDCSNKTEVIKDSMCLGIKDQNSCIGGSHTIRRIKPNLSNKYYSSTTQYLKSRQKTYDSNQILGEKINNTTYKSVDVSGCNVTYKPNNSYFKTQGSVPSGLNTTRKRNQEIIKNSNSFKQEYKLSGSNFLSYESQNPFFDKTKTNVCSKC